MSRTDEIILVENLLRSALETPLGIRVWASNEGKFKQLFYQVRKLNPHYSKLSLLFTSKPGIYLIYHGEENGENRLGKVDNQD